MLVYANHLTFHGAGAPEAVFRGVGGWLKEQLGFGLHPDQLKQPGEFDGQRGEVRSWLRVYATNEERPELYAWVLKTLDETVYGRQWIVEVGLKVDHRAVELSCVLKTDEYSTLVASPVAASQPRLIRYVVNNIAQADADFAPSVFGVVPKHVGGNRNSYIALLAEIERQDRNCPIVLVSPTRDGDYLVNVSNLQQSLIGLGQVVEVSRDFNSYEMAEVLGQGRSAWSGAINVLNIPTRTGLVRGRIFLSDVIAGWGDVPQERISRLLSWVTSNTNIPRLRRHIRPEGVMQLALRRRIQRTRAKSAEMDASQLRQELEESSRRSAEQEEYFKELVEESSQLQADISELKDDLDEAKDQLTAREFSFQALKDQLAKASGGRTSSYDAEALLDLISRSQAPTPSDCLALLESIYGDKCTVLPDAKQSARDMNRFVCGRELLELLRRLVTDYRTSLMAGGDNEARKVFGKNEYAAKESETVMANKVMRRQRTFEYDGKPVEMFRHLKIGVGDDVTKTMRVHFHWDAERKKIIIGYCGEHLDISSR